MGAILRSAAAVIICISGTATAGPSAMPSSPALQRLSHNCQCLAGNRRYAQGEVACIRGQRMQCGMSLNNASWHVLSGACQENRLSLAPAPTRRIPPFTPM